MGSSSGARLSRGCSHICKGTRLMPRHRSVLARFFEKTRKTAGGCLLWTGSLDRKGYGRFRPGRRVPAGRTMLAHHFAFEFANGREVRKGFHLDHLCRRPACVAVAHLEEVTPRENTRREQVANNRGQAVTHCPAGHAYDAKNTYVNGRTRKRYCRLCGRATTARYLRRKKGQA